MDSLYFMDRGLILATLSMEMGVFVDRVMKLMAPARKRGVFMATKVENEKGDIPERMSP